GIVLPERPCAFRWKDGKLAVQEQGNMARPLSTSDPFRGGTNGNHARYQLDNAAASAPPEVDALREENAQLRALCGELEQALQEATQQTGEAAIYEERIRDYEAILEEKSETIRALHQQLQDAQAALEDQGARPARPQGPVPREDELLALSED